jgi:hypothetical protein
VKLLIENWRNYIKESEEAAIYGHLYLFEGDRVSKTLFSDAINNLSESDEDVAIFLENWKRSIDHTFTNLDENIATDAAEKTNTAILKAVTQGYVALHNYGPKAIGAVASLVKRLKATSEKELGPKTTALIGAVAVPLAGALAYSAGMALSQAGVVNDSAVSDSLQSAMKLGQRIAVEMGSDVDFQSALQDLGGNAPANQAAEYFTAPEGWVHSSSDAMNRYDLPYSDENRWWSPEQIKAYYADMEKAHDTTAKIVNDPGLEQAMGKYEDGVQQQWSDMFAQADTRRASDAVGELRKATTYDEFMTILKNGETPDYRALQDLAIQIESGEFDGEGRKALKDLIKQMPKGPEKRQLRGFIRARDSAKVLQTILNVTPHGAVVNVIDKLDTGGKIFQTAADVGGSDFAGQVARDVTKLGKSLGE